MTEKTEHGDFVELKFAGYANGKPFDSNIEEELKKINPNAKPEKIIVVIGEKMVVEGFDNALENKEINKEYEVEIKAEKGFGPRIRALVRTIPLKSFTEQKVSPFPGMVLALDNTVVKIIAVSGARVIADFNNPLAGKDLKYRFTILRVIKDEKEKTETILKLLFKKVPEYSIEEKKVVVKGPKNLGLFVSAFKEKFKNLLNKELEFEEITLPKEKQKTEEKQPAIEELSQL